MPRLTLANALLSALIIQLAPSLSPASAPATLTAAPNTTPTANPIVQSTFQNAVMRVEVARAHRDWDSPWKLSTTATAFGTSFVVAGDRLLTNAHVVRDAEQITVKKSDGSAPAIATVEAVDEECDLALLRVSDTSFLTGLHPLPLGDLPEIGSSVTIYGYPVGGQQMSTTVGVVSRIESHAYSEGVTSHLTIQTDAAINHGNSGGPVVQGGAIVGVAFQLLAAGQNIGYVIPAPIVRHFLDDLADGKYTGFADPQFAATPLESPALRRERGLPARESGVVVEAIYTGSNLEGVLEPDDIITSVDGKKVSDDGTFAWGTMRLPFWHLIDVKPVGEKVRFTVWRNGTTVSNDWTASRYAPLDRMRARGAAPRYLVYGGLLFVAATHDFLRAVKPTKENRAAIVRAIDDQMWGPKENLDREVVLLAKIIHDPINEGFSPSTPAIIERVNGQRVRSLTDLAHLLDESHQKHDVFEFAAPFHYQGAIDHEHAITTRASFLETHGINHDRNL